MTTVCIQCSMVALLNDQPPPSFDETPEEHQRRVHPDPDVTLRERSHLVAKIAIKMAHQ